MAKKKVTCDVMVNDRFYKTVHVIVVSMPRWFDGIRRDIFDPDDIEKAVLAEPSESEDKETQHKYLPMKTKEEIRQYHHERWLRIKADPVLHEEFKAKTRERYHNRNNKAKAQYLAQQRERCREYREKNRETIKSRQHEYNTHWYQTMMADPEKRARYRRYKRDWYMKRKYGNEN